MDPHPCPENMPTDAHRAALADDRIVSVTVYEDGWVANSYKWASVGRKTVFHRRDFGDGWNEVEETYDRRRSYGVGPIWVGFSERGGRLASG